MRQRQEYIQPWKVEKPFTILQLCWLEANNWEITSTSVSLLPVGKMKVVIFPFLWPSFVIYNWPTNIRVFFSKQHSFSLICLAFQQLISKQMHHHITETYSRCLSFKCVLLQETETVRVFWLGFFGGGFFCCFLTLSEKYFSYLLLVSPLLLILYTLV